MDDRRVRELEALIEPFGSVIVAFSGGVDSSLVAAIAARALGDRALAVTAVSPALATGELDGAREVARAIGISHRTITTDELSRPEYRRNDRFRCYHCKTELYDRCRRSRGPRDSAGCCREPTPTMPATGDPACARPRSTASAIRCSRPGSARTRSGRSRAGWASRAPTSRPRPAWRRGCRTEPRSAQRRSRASTAPKLAYGRWVIGSCASATTASSAGSNSRPTSCHGRLTIRSRSLRRSGPPATAWRK